MSLTGAYARGHVVGGALAGNYVLTEKLPADYQVGKSVELEGFGFRWPAAAEARTGYHASAGVELFLATQAGTTPAIATVRFGRARRTDKSDAVLMSATEDWHLGQMFGHPAFALGTTASAGSRRTCTSTRC